MESLFHRNSDSAKGGGFVEGKCARGFGFRQPGVAAQSGEIFGFVVAVADGDRRTSGNGESDSENGDENFHENKTVIHRLEGFSLDRMKGNRIAGKVGVASSELILEG